MQSISWLLATRYLPFHKGDSSIRTMAIICFIATAIGAFSLALVTAVMNGFQATIHEKMQNINPQATIYASQDPINFTVLEKTLQKEYPNIKALSPYSIGHAMIQSDYTEEDETPKVIALKAIDPSKEILVTSLSQKMRHGSIQDISKDTIVIGSSLAESLGVQPGEELTLLYIEAPSGKRKKVSVHQKKVIIGGLFETGIDEYDNGTIYGSFELIEKLFPELGVTQVGIAFNDQSTPFATIETIKKLTGLNVMTWQELYLPLVSALMLEKHAMFFILTLITLVASMNLIALLFMLITYKKADIAILKALGASNGLIARTFMFVGLAISILATALGLAGALGASWLLETYPFIELPDVYYVSHLPARMESSILLAVFLINVAIALIATWFSCRKIKTIKSAHILRFEG